MEVKITQSNFGAVLTQQGYWFVPKLWDNDVVYIIGGGTSLTGFDWTRFHSRHIIGCNDAYLLGDWVDFCIFGDINWYHIHKLKKEFQEYKGIKVTIGRHLVGTPGILSLRKKTRGLAIERDELAWNCNTGAAAINLALHLGAKKIVLLGFDMKLGEKGNANWHVNLKDKPNPNSYVRFQRFYPQLAKGLTRFPEVQVLNANPDSGLTVFPKVRIDDVI